jgi:hypothetical protein
VGLDGSHAGLVLTYGVYALRSCTASALLVLALRFEAPVAYVGLAWLVLALPLSFVFSTCIPQY